MPHRRRPGHRRPSFPLLLALAATAVAGNAAPSAQAQSSVVSTVAGTGASGFAGDGGAAFSAQLNIPLALAVTANNGYLIADQGNSRVRLVAADGSITTFAGSGTNGFGGDNGPATAAQLSGVNGMAATSAGGALIADANNNRIRYVTPAGVIHTVAGTGAQGFSGDGGQAASAQIRFPADVAVQADGGYLIADADNHRVRRVAPDGVITTVAGNGTAASGGDGGPATSAQLNKPSGVARTPDGGYLITEQLGNRVRRVAPDGSISTVAGNGFAGAAGDGGPATAAELNGPVGVAIAGDGSIVIADRLNHRIRQVATDGTITTVVGTGTGGYNGDGATGTATDLNNAFDVSVDAQGDYLIADTSNHRVRRFDAPVPPTAPPADPPPPVPEPVIPPTPVERNLTQPQIRATGGAEHSCQDGTWEGLAADPAFAYRWVRYDLGANGFLQLTTVGSAKTYTLPPKSKGLKHYCEVYARGASGRLLSAYSPTMVLTGSRLVLPVIVQRQAYGDFRIRGIDVFQTTQPASGAQQYGFPTRGFPSLCGGGTPTSFLSDPVTGCSLSGRDAQLTSYAGVSVDRQKRAWALVFVDMNGEAASSASQKLEVLLSGFVAGTPLPGGMTKTTTSPPLTTTRWITAAERVTREHYLLFPLPGDWLATAAGRGQRLDLEATVQLPTGAGSGATTECPTLLLTNAAHCGVNNRFRLNGVSVFDNLQVPQRVTIRSLPLTKPGQLGVAQPGVAGTVLTPPEQVMQRTRDLMPGGEGLNILPYDAALAIDPEALTAANAACMGIPLRTCRSNHVSAEVRVWQALPGNSSGYQMLMGVHEYNTGSVGTEPGWSQGGSITDGSATMFVNAGSVGRPLTATAHEYIHALGVPHADTTCGGDTRPEVGEAWPPDNAGNLQGVAFQAESSGFAIAVTMRADTVAAPLIDLMSYCTGASDASSWLSPRNWNRTFAAMQAHQAAGPRAAASARAAQAGQGFVVGSVNPSGARIDRVIPPAVGNVIPPPSQSAPLRVRSTDAAGRVLADAPATVEFANDIPGAGVFIAAVPREAAAVEVVGGGAVLDRRERSRPPTVRLTAPARPARVRSGLRVRWSAADPDGDALQGRVEYSLDDGRRWRTVYQGPSTGSVAIPRGFLAAGARARVRVVVNDGFNEARAISPRLRVDGTRPLARLIAPATGDQLQAGPVRLSGSGLDDARRRLRGRALTWFAGSRRLGSGETLRTKLRAGTVNLRLQVRDSRGRVATARRRLRVSPPMLVLTALRPAARVRARARSVRVAIATSVPARLRAGGRTYSTGPRRRTLTIPLPARPKAGVLRVPLAITARGVRQAKLTETILVLRI